MPSSSVKNSKVIAHKLQDLIDENGGHLHNLALDYVCDAESDALPRLFNCLLYDQSAIATDKGKTRAYNAEDIVKEFNMRFVAKPSIYDHD
ncbi:hypothetical protein MUCCIDRAFT_107105 [Mucor lusitanicus CBS 277.49]|uniref:Uncharacterized protein n=1 Tax=Mucor lusitanicus CBS 277.49 TaxID=747725 RepID=A0A168NNN5_MUCCL|nr:hypothetical protein MUCCIDRAFT_107105 [Mucor lusitanicus CBS 277.49]